MASLTLTIGTITASVSATNAKATALLAEYADAIGAEGTNQQRAHQVVQALARHISDTARDHKRRVVVRAAEDGVVDELSGLDWSE